MKRLFLLLTAIALVSSASAQDSTKVKVLNKNVVTVREDSVGTQVKVGNNPGVEVISNNEGDTVSVRIGKRVFDVIEGQDGTEVRTAKKAKEDKSSKKFQGSWQGIGLGMNTLTKNNYSMYSGGPYSEEGEFFDINHAKSLTFDLNFAEFAFANEKKTFALVSGLGVSFMDYRFDKAMTVAKDDELGYIVPVELSGDVKKTKLSVSYLTAPLLLEVKTPLRMGNERLSLAAGVVGGLNIGSHTKVKYDDAKDKERRNFNINPLKYDLTGRIGLGDFVLYANYGMTSMFKANKGPEINPLTIGLVLRAD